MIFLYASNAKFPQLFSLTSLSARGKFKTIFNIPVKHAEEMFYTFIK